MNIKRFESNSNNTSAKNKPISKLCSALSAGLCVLAVVAMAVFFGTAGFTAEAAGTETALTFTDSSVTASGGSAGVEIDGTDLTISQSGTFILTGSCSDGSVTVKKGTTDVTLVLDGLSLSSSDSAAISCNKESAVTLQVNGTNTLTDAEDIANEEADGFDGAAVKVKSSASLTITGDGTLTVNGNCKNGIKGAALSTVTVDSSTLIVNAENNGIACDNAVVINGGRITVNAGNDGIKAEPDEGDTDSAGSVTINGGTVKISSTGDSVQAVGELTITGGIFDISSGDDAFKSAGNITVSGGTFQISAEDDGISADYVITVGAEGASSGPDITITKCTEGLEGAAVNLHSGKAVITSGDDGINAANGDLADYDYAINVTGGSWYVNANGDAMDSNGDINITAGIVELFGAPNNGNNALDYARKCTVSGGTLFTVDCTGMNQVPSYGTYVVFGKTGGAGMMPGGQMPQMGENNEMPTPPDGMTPPDFSGSTDGQTDGGMTPPEFSGNTGGQMRGGMTPPEFSGHTGGQTGGGMTPPEFSGNTDGQTGGGMMPPEFSGNTDGQTGGGPGAQAENSSMIRIQSGSRIEIKDSSDNTLYSATGVKAANCVMLASEDLKAGETYTLYIDGEAVAEAETLEGSGQGGFDPDTGGGHSGQEHGQQGGAQTSDDYYDVDSGSWYADAVRNVTEKGLMNGVAEDKFDPQGTTTRAMIVTILYRLEGEPEVEGENAFDDVEEGQWYTDAVVWANSNEIVNGYGEGKFGPTDNITREQFAAILYRYAQFKGYDVSVGEDTNILSYNDASDISEWAMPAMQWACGAGLMQGDNNSLLPGDNATRAQAAALFMRFTENVK
ncbi:MAG: carbohydrate-binding domain-containing protein [Oscillospiraceae bacterium]|nr:carbohydrate-binding domain-containing protein [Oscillospiraceae bacterium]